MHKRFTTQTRLSSSLLQLSKSSRWNDPTVYRSVKPTPKAASTSTPRKFTYAVPKQQQQPGVAVFGSPAHIPASVEDVPGAKVHLCSGLSAFQPSPRVLDAVQSQVRALASRHRADLNVGPGGLALHPSSLRSNVTSDEAFHVLDLERVVEKYKHWTECFPTITPFYAVKSNPNPEIVRTLARLGCGFDCASPFEFEMVLGMGVPTNKIIYANPCKSPDAITAARNAGVYMTTFDCEGELVKMATLAPKTELVLRISVDDRDAQCPLSNKFGASLGEAQHLLKLAKCLGMDVVGVSFHVGSGGTASTYAFALEDARKVFDMAAEVGHKMRLLDIGGGFPGTCGSSSINLKMVASIVNPLLSNFPADIQVISEPGRYFCAESQTLAAMIIGKRVRGNKTSYFIADGVYQSFNCIMYDHSSVLPTTGDGELFESNIFGQTCDGLDEVSKSISLPSLDVGDWIAFPTMGAYTLAAASRFNGFRVPHLVVLEPESL